MSNSHSEEQEILRLLHGLNRMAFQQKDEASSSHLHELTILQMHVVRLIQAKKAVTMSDIVKSFAIAPASATGVVDRLEEGGWVERKRDPEDRRVVQLVLAEGVDKKLDAVMRAKAEGFAQLTEKLTQDEKADLIRILSKLETNN